jgi:hypothetical protein
MEYLSGVEIKDGKVRRSKAMLLPKFNLINQDKVSDET